MSITLSPAKAAYLSRVAEGLSDLPFDDRDEVMQDLEAHLGELPDDTLEQVLGTPEGFVSEFRTSAGLDQSPLPPRPGLITRWRARVDRHAAWLSNITHWQTFRPVWVWSRGWLLICGWSLVYDVDGFSRFPIPTVNQSTATGLVLVVAATALSVWLDVGPAGQRWRSIGTTVFSAVSALVLVGTLLNPMPTYTQMVHNFEQSTYIEQLTAGGGNPITNIYAYDMEGNPVEVLLFDQSGRPLLTFPTYVYDDAEIPGSDASYWDGGTVTFPRDGFGRIIPNLYPLELAVYDEYGELAPVPPPSLGFPARDEPEDVPDEETVPTTLGFLR